MGKSVNELINALPIERRNKVDAKARAMAAEMIAEAQTLEALRKAVGKTQSQVARSLGINQNAVSQLENRTEIYLSTLQKYLKALGMELEVALKTKSGNRIALSKFRPWDGNEVVLRRRSAIQVVKADSKAATGSYKRVKAVAGDSRTSRA